ncbi:hypothetical protein FRC06_006653 [Ceratobasidium sp. 370]|nr:hypothetical protein FRC06_006653 [Ceratobasidium sp. 370]
MKQNPLRRRYQHQKDLITYLRRTTHPFKHIIEAVGIDLSHPVETFPESFEGSCALLQNPFPDLDEMLRWECFEGILTEDLDRKEVDQLFSGRQTWIELSLNKWRTRLEEQLVEELRAKGEKCAEVILTVKGSSDPTANLSSNTRVLLRADTIFRYKSSAGMYFYPGFITSFDNTNYAYLDFHGYRDQHSSIARPSINPHRYEQHTGAQAIAKSILKELHMPDATHFELLAIGRRFTCGRCPHEKNNTWFAIIDHYVHQLRHWNLQHNDPNISSMRHPIVHRNTHCLDPIQDSRPLVRILAEEEDQDADMNTAKEVCQLCVFTRGLWFRSRLDNVLVHLQDVHDIVDAVEGIHYGRTNIDSKIWLAKWDAFHESQATATTRATVDKPT